MQKRFFPFPYKRTAWLPPCRPRWAMWGPQGTGPMAGYHLYGSIFRLDQTIVAIFALIQDVYMALFRILKHVEGMAQQLHLQNGFLHAHGLDGKPLYPNDLALFLLPIL